MSSTCQATLSSVSKSSTGMSDRVRAVAFGAIAIGLCLCIGADSREVQDPLIISADDIRGSLDGAAEASGNVVLQQGSMQLDADKVLLHTEDGTFVSFEATGSPIRFRFQVGQDDELQTLNGEAASLVFRLDDNWIEFRGDAEILSDEMSIVGDIIRFDLQNNQFEAKSTNPDKQVEITILDIGSLGETEND